MVDVVDGPESVLITLRDTTTGATSLVEARHVVAADGAHSATRRAVGVAMHGPDRLEDGANVLFHAPLWDLLGEHRYGIYAADDGEHQGIFLPAGTGDRWLFGLGASAHRGEAEQYTPQGLTRLLRACSGVADLPVRLERFGTLEHRLHHSAAA
ncbi:Tetracenomycin polyketide synthesis hydroxylase tcmG (fragment) [Frankia canadensis]|uniref:Tetracenomycin polyketide synthesis hydroxylase tcmG n=1 Tax=Frankia canadensis TaxID=1836972 RepID=A0A2I2KNK5_9ACTN